MRVVIFTKNRSKNTGVHKQYSRLFLNQMPLFKQVFILMICIVVSIATYAQAPQKMSYQSVLRNTTGQLLVNQSVGLKISILQGSASGTVVYAETQSATTNAFGLISIQVGAGTVVSGSMSAIDWGSGPYYIKTETDPSGGTTYTISGATEMLSVPYALYSGNGISALGTPAGSNAKAGSISGNTLTLSLADATNPGIVSTGAQTLAGDKTLSGNTILSGTAALNGNTTLASGKNLTLTGLNSSMLKTDASGVISAASPGTDYQLALTNPVTANAASASSGQLAIFSGTGNQVTATNILPTTAVPAFTGDVTNTAGSLANTVAKLQGTPLTLSGLTTNNLLQYNGSAWVNAAPASILGSTLSAGTGISISGATISNAGVTSFSGGTTGLTPASSSVGAITMAGTLAVANGGTGATTLTSNGVLYGNGTAAIQALAPGTSGYVLTSAGAGSAPTWASLPSASWSLTGNSGTSSATNFIGTTDNQDLIFKVNNQKAGQLGGSNTSFGYQALYSCTTGANNVAIGKVALSSATDASENIAIGDQTLNETVHSKFNVAVGHGALLHHITGDGNIGIGFSALINNGTGTDNVALGNGAGSGITTGSNNIAIGSNAQVPVGTNSNQLNIGNSIYGLNMGTSTVAVGIGTTNPLSGLSVWSGNSTSNTNFFDREGYAAHIGNSSNAPYSNGLLVSNYWRAASSYVFAVDGALMDQPSWPAQTHSPYFIVRGNGLVGIGTSAPASTLEVSGAATNVAPLANASATIDFSANNLAYTSYAVANPAFTLSNMKNGGAYTLMLTGTTNSGTATFTASGFTVKYMGTVDMTSGKMHIYSFIVAGGYVFVSMATEN